MHHRTRRDAPSPSSSMPCALRYRLSTEGGSIDALVDSGAELSLISEDAVKRRGIRVQPLENPLDIVMANQSRVRASHCVPSLPLVRGPWEDSLYCVVVPSLSEALFLGRDWLEKWNPVIDWVTGTLLVGGEGPSWVPKGDRGMGEEDAAAQASGIEEMTPSAFRKWLRVSL